MLLVKTYIKDTGNKGFGLFASNFIAKDTLIWMFIEGFDIQIKQELFDILPPIAQEYLDKYAWQPKNGVFNLDGDNARFMNHSNQPNSTINESMCFVAAKDILQDEEITCDYKTFDIDDKEKLSFEDLDL